MESRYDGRYPEPPYEIEDDVIALRARIAELEARLSMAEKVVADAEAVVAQARHGSSCGWITGPCNCGLAAMGISLAAWRAQK